jgi:hypothetical protein
MGQQHAPEEFQYELLLRDDGTAMLTLGGDVMWASDGDSNFAEEFGDELLDSEDIPDVIDWLTGAGYLPPGVEPAVEDESNDGPADDDDDDDEDDDENWEDDEDEE